MSALQNKVALVTGASRGIGADVALTLARQGARVVVNYAENDAAADKVVRTIREEGGDAFAVRANVAHSAEMRALFDATIERYGKLDILINNAGIMILKPMSDVTDEDYQRQFDVNVRGVVNGLREAANRLADGGRVINISSAVTRLMLPTYGLYAATKGAVEQLTRFCARELGARGITVNAVLPGPTSTELFNAGKDEETIARIAAMTAFNRIGQPIEVVQLVAWLATDEAGWVTAQCIGANGGIA